jgi:ATP-binding cassette subfamily C protein
MARHLRFAVLFEKDAKELKHALIRQVFSKNALRVLQELIIVVILAGGFYGAIDVLNYRFEEITFVAVVLIKLVMTIGQAQRQLQNVQQTESAFWSMQQTIREVDEAKESYTGTDTPTLERGIEFRDVSFAFDRKEVLEKVSLFVPAGEVTTVTGGSGAGKTTTADLVLGLYVPRDGTVLIDGMPMTDVDLLKWRMMTGYVPQEVILFHDTIHANIALGDPKYDHAAVREALEAAGAWDFVAQLPDGMDSVVGERGALLSGGQRQRIAVARAIVHRPKLVILDEATSALDPETESAICKNLKDLSRRTGLTILAITHQPAWVEAADKIYRVVDGAVLENTPVPATRMP